MKLQKDSIGTLAVVGLLTAFLFTVLYREEMGWGGRRIYAMQFAFYPVMLIEAICGLPVAWICRKRFRFVAADGMVLLSGGYLVLQFYLLHKGSAGRLEIMVLYVVLYFLVRMILSLHRESAKAVHFVLIAAALAEGIHGLGQLYGYYTPGHSLFRLTGAFFNPGPYSGFLAVILPLVLYYCLDARFDLLKMRLPHTLAEGGYLAMGVFLWLALLTVVTVLPAGMSRSSWLAAAAGCGVVVAFRYHWGTRGKKWLEKKRRVMLPVVGGIFLGGALLLSGLYLLKKDSADGRWLMWKVSLRAMQEQPWTGVGPGYFCGAFGKAQAAYFASGKASPQEERVAGAPEYGFNEYLQLGVETGILGLIGFVGMVGLVIFRLLHYRPEGWPATLGALLAFLVFACFSYPLSIVPLAILFVLLLALGATPAEYPVPALQRVPLVIPLMALAGLGLVVWINRDKEELKEAYGEWGSEQTYFNMNIFEGTVDNYRRLYPLLYEQPRFLFEYGQCLAKTGQYEESSRILLEGTTRSADPMFYNILGKNAGELKQYELAEFYFRRAAALIPNRLYPDYLLIRMLLESGQQEKAAACAAQFLRREPKVMSDAVDEMKSEIRERMEMEGLVIEGGK